MTDAAAEILSAFGSGGFMYQARQMVFDELAAARFIASIEKIEPEANPNARYKIVKILWDIPFLALLYEEQCVKAGADARKYRRVVVELRRMVEKKMDLLLSPALGAGEELAGSR